MIRRLAWLLWAISIVVTVADIFPNHALGKATFDPIEAAFLAFATVGALIASRHPSNSLGWLFIAVGLGAMLSNLSQDYAEYAVFIRGSEAGSAAVWAEWIGSWLWPMSVSLVLLIFLLFPTGRPSSPRWRPVIWMAGLTLVAEFATLALRPGPLGDTKDFPFDNPMGVSGAKAFVSGLTTMFGPFLVVVLLAGVGSVIMRTRNAGPEERNQLQWFAVAAAFVALDLAVSPVVITLFGSNAGNYTFTLAALALPLGMGVAILKYHLYDIDVVINKTLVYGSLAAFITAVYVAIVVGAGALLGSQGKPNLALSIAATAIVAVVFQPVRERVQRVANRVVYGERATPYEVLTDFSRALASVVSVEDVLPEVARHVGVGLAAESVVVTAYLPAGAVLTARYPLIGDTSADTTVTIPVTFRTESVGAIAIAKGRSEPVRSHERKLLEQLAAHTGVVLHNLRLALNLREQLDHLAAQADDLRDSRERLVSAADTSRRSIEEAITEGVKSRLIAIAHDVSSAEALMRTDPRSATQALEEIAVQINEALETLRELARGIFPPLLADKGLLMALEAQIRKSGADVTLDLEGISGDKRFDRATETTCYFFIREAVTNVQKHAPGAPTRVSLAASGDRLTFSVTDEGPGFDTSAVTFGAGLQSIADRVSAVGGEWRVESTPGTGTKVTGWLPLINIEELAASQPVVNASDPVPSHAPSLSIS